MRFHSVPYYEKGDAKLEFVRVRFLSVCSSVLYERLRFLRGRLLLCALLPSHSIKVLFVRMNAKKKGAMFPSLHCALSIEC